MPLRLEAKKKEKSWLECLFTVLALVESFFLFLWTDSKRHNPTDRFLVVRVSSST